MKINLAKSVAVKSSPAKSELRHASAILVKFHGPTNTRGSRVKAEFLNYGRDMKPLSSGWDHELTPEQNHAAVAARLAQREGRKLDGLVINAGYGYIFPMAAL